MSTKRTRRQSKDADVEVEIPKSEPSGPEILSAKKLKTDDTAAVVQPDLPSSAMMEEGDDDSDISDSVSDDTDISANSGKRKRKGSDAEILKHFWGTTTGECDEAELRCLKWWAMNKENPQIKTFLSRRVLDMLNSIDITEVSTPSEQVGSPFTLSEICHLRDYQLQGLQWLVENYYKGTNCFLCDEMGLGKTLQVISFIAHLVHVKRVPGIHLIVVPLTLLFNWMSEFKKWCPSLKVQRLHSNQKDDMKRLKLHLQDNSGTINVVVTTYDILKSGMRSFLRGICWRSIILDEGHRVKNENSHISKACCQLQGRFKLILTGTPIQNNLHESWAMLNFLAPKIFDDSSAFDNAFGSKSGNERQKKRPTESEAEGAGETISVDKFKLSEAHYLLRPMMLRRLKSEVENTLPIKLETLIKCPMTALQKKIVASLLVQEKDNIQTFVSKTVSPTENEIGSIRYCKMQSLLAQLRKAANHPFLFPKIEIVEDKEGRANEDIVTSSGKMLILSKLLAKLKNNGHRVVLFSQFTRTLDIIEDFLDLRGYRHCRLDGSTNRIMREVLVNMYNKPQSEYFIFCLSTRAGGEGINLCSADTVILFDSDWNPQVDIQAMARVHRIGQTKPVHVYRLVTQNSVEERIVQRAQHKLYLDGMVNRGSTAKAIELDSTDSKEYDDPQGMLAVLKYGWNSIFSIPEGTQLEDDLLFSEEEFDLLIDRSRGTAVESSAKSEPRKTSAMLQENQEKSLGEFDESIALVPIRNISNLPSVVVDIDKECEIEDPIMSEAAIESAQDQPRRTRRSSSSRTSEVYVKDVGMMNIMSKDSLLSQDNDSSAKASSQLDSFMPRKGGKQVSGRDYGHQSMCQLCWRGGELIFCDSCPLAFHLKCAGLSSVPNEKWYCPHHRCAYCFRTGTAAGLLFRCEMCCKAFCEDCVPANYDTIGHSPRLEHLGFRMPASACYIHCSRECIDRAQAMSTTTGVSRGPNVEATAETPVEITTTSAMASDINRKAVVASDVPGLTSALNDALQACKLTDIEVRLKRNKTLPKCKFSKLSDCPGFIERWNSSVQQIKSILVSILELLELRINPSHGRVITSVNMDARVPSADSDEKVVNFRGIAASHSYEFIADCFITVTRALTQVRKRDLCILSKLLGICLFARPFQWPKKFLEDNPDAICIPEPRFRWISPENCTVNVNELEECIAAYLVTLSPLNLLMRATKAREVPCVLTAEINLPMNSALTLARFLESFVRSAKNDQDFTGLSALETDSAISISLHEKLTLIQGGGPTNIEELKRILQPCVDLARYRFAQKATDTIRAPNAMISEDELDDPITLIPMNDCFRLMLPISFIPVRAPQPTYVPPPHAHVDPASVAYGVRGAYSDRSRMSEGTMVPTEAFATKYDVPAMFIKPLPDAGQIKKYELQLIGCVNIPTCLSAMLSQLEILTRRLHSTFTPEPGQTEFRIRQMVPAVCQEVVSFICSKYLKVDNFDLFRYLVLWTDATLFKRAKNWREYAAKDTLPQRVPMVLSIMNNNSLTAVANQLKLPTAWKFANEIRKNDKDLLIVLGRSYTAIIGEKSAKTIPSASLAPLFASLNIVERIRRLLPILADMLAAYLVDYNIPVASTQTNSVGLTFARFHNLLVSLEIDQYDTIKNSELYFNMDDLFRMQLMYQNLDKIRSKITAPGLNDLITDWSESHLSMSLQADYRAGNPYFEDPNVFEGSMPPNPWMKQDTTTSTPMVSAAPQSYTMPASNAQKVVAPQQLTPSKVVSCKELCRKFSYCLKSKTYIDACFAYMCALNPDCNRTDNLESILRNISFLIVDNMSPRQQQAIETYHQFRYVVLGIFTKVFNCSPSELPTAIEMILQSLTSVEIDALSERIRSYFATILANNCKINLSNDAFLSGTYAFYALVLKKKGFVPVNSDLEDVILNNRLTTRAHKLLPVLSDIVGAYVNDYNIASFANQSMTSRRFCNLVVILDVDIFSTCVTPEVYFQKSLEELVISVYSRLDLIKPFLNHVILDPNADEMMASLTLMPPATPKSAAIVPQQMPPQTTPLAAQMMAPPTMQMHMQANKFDPASNFPPLINQAMQPLATKSFGYNNNFNTNKPGQLGMPGSMQMPAMPAMPAMPVPMPNSHSSHPPPAIKATTRPTQDPIISLEYHQRFIDSFNFPPQATASSAFLESLTRRLCSSPKFNWSKWHIDLRVKLKLPLMSKTTADFLNSRRVVPESYLPFTHLVMGVDTYIFLNAKTWEEYRNIIINGDQVQSALQLMAKDEVLAVLSNAIKSSAASVVVTAFKNELATNKNYYRQIAANYDSSIAENSNTDTLELSDAVKHRIDKVLPVLADAYASFMLDWGIAHTVSNNVAELGSVLVALEILIFNSCDANQYFKIDTVEIGRQVYSRLDAARLTVSPANSAGINGSILSQSNKHRSHSLSLFSLFASATPLPVSSTKTTGGESPTASAGTSSSVASEESWSLPDSGLLYGDDSATTAAIGSNSSGDGKNEQNKSELSNTSPIDSSVVKKEGEAEDKSLISEEPEYEDNNEKSKSFSVELTTDMLLAYTNAPNTRKIDFCQQFVESLLVPSHFQASVAFLDSLTRRLCTSPKFSWSRWHIELRVKIKLPIISAIAADYLSAHNLASDGYLPFTHLVMGVDTYIFLNARSWEEYRHVLTSHENVERALASMGKVEVLSALSTAIRGSAAAKVVGAFRCDLRSPSFVQDLRAAYPVHSEFKDAATLNLAMSYRIEKVLPTLAEAYAAFVLDWGIAHTVVQSTATLGKALVALDVDLFNSATSIVDYFQMNAIELCVQVYNRLDAIRKKLPLPLTAPAVNEEILLLSNNKVALTNKPIVVPAKDVGNKQSYSAAKSLVGSSYCEQLLESLEIPSYFLGATKFLEALTTKFKSDTTISWTPDMTSHRLKNIIPTVCIHLSFAPSARAVLSQLAVDDYDKFRFMVFAVESYMFRGLSSWQDYLVEEVHIKARIDNIIADIKQTPILEALQEAINAVPLELIRIKHDITADSLFFKSVCNSYADKAMLAKTTGSTIMAARQFRAKNILPILAGILSTYLADNNVASVSSMWRSGFASMLTSIDTDIFNSTNLKVGSLGHTNIDVVALTREVYVRLDEIFEKSKLSPSGASGELDASFGLPSDNFSASLPVEKFSYDSNGYPAASTIAPSPSPQRAPVAYAPKEGMSVAPFAATKPPAGSYPAASVYPGHPSADMTSAQSNNLMLYGMHDMYSMSNMKYPTSVYGPGLAPPMAPPHGMGHPLPVGDMKPPGSMLGPSSAATASGIPVELISHHSGSMGCLEYADLLLAFLSFKPYIDATLAYLARSKPTSSTKFTWTRQQFEVRVRVIIPLVCRNVADYILKTNLLVESFDQFRYFVLRVDSKLFESASSMDAYENKETLLARSEYVISQLVMSSGLSVAKTVPGAYVSGAFVVEMESAAAWKLAAQFKLDLLKKPFLDELLNKYVEAIKLRTPSSSASISLQSLQYQRLMFRITNIIPGMADILASYLNDYSISAVTSMTTARFGNVLVNLDTFIYAASITPDNYFSLDITNRACQMYLKLDESFGRNMGTGGPSFGVHTNASHAIFK